MTEFYTIIGVKGNALSADTQASSNAHNSVRSYKTVAAARQAIVRGAKKPGVAYRLLRSRIDDWGNVYCEWVED